MSWKGTRTLEETFYFHFTTRQFSTGAPFTLAGTPSLAAYEDNSDTQITAGLTLAVDADAKTGFNRVTVVATAANGYEAGKDYDIVIEAGTVDSVSVVGEVVGTFRIGTVPADVTEISGDSGAADNLELMYDGTGYTDDTAPASRAQVDGIGSGSGGALNFEATEDNASSPIKGVSKVGTETGTYTNTAANDGTTHSIAHAANDIDWIYGYDVGGSRQAVEVTFHGYLNSANDAMSIQAYDFVGAGWDTVAPLPGKGGTTNDTIVAALLSKHTGTGADLGKVYIRFEADGVMTSPTLEVDQLIVSAVATNTSIGYVGGAVWIDTALSNTSTESFVDGTADNPVSTIAAANTIASNLNLKRLHILPGSSVTLAATQANDEFVGQNYMLALGGQDITGAYIYHCTSLSGIGTGTNGTPIVIQECQVGTVTLDAFAFLELCALSDTLTLASTGGVSADAMTLINCTSSVAGASSPTITAAGVTKTTVLNIRRWSGGLTLTLNSFCTASLDSVSGGGVTLTANGADVEIRGIHRDVTIAVTGGETIQLAGVFGDITITGNTTGSAATINISGVAGNVTDSTTGLGATVTNDAVSREHIESRTLASASYFDPAADTVANVTTVGTTTTNTDMRGTDNAALASVATEARLAELDAANLPADIDQIKGDLPSTITKNVALAGYPFVMTDSTNHDPTASLTVTAERSIDGAAYGACANAVVEVANGLYKIDLAAADLNGDTIALRFTASGADDLVIVIVTQP